MQTPYNLAASLVPPGDGGYRDMRPQGEAHAVPKIHCTCPDGIPDGPPALCVCYDCGTLHHKACLDGRSVRGKYIAKSRCASCSHRTPGSKKKSRYIGDALREQMNSRTMETKPLKFLHKKDISCECPERDWDVAENHVPCARCKRAQHEGCMRGELDGTEVQECNTCLDVAAKKNKEAMLWRKKYTIYRRALEDSIDIDFLWRHYCSLPKGKSVPAVVVLTATKYQNGSMTPIHRPPLHWIDEIKYQLDRLIVTTPQEVLDFLLGPVSSPCVKSNEQSLAVWRKLAVGTVHHGRYKGGRQELGLALELFGLVEKGVFWKGLPRRDSP